MRKGTPAQFMHELKDKIDELKGVESSAVIVNEDDEIIEADENIDEFKQAEDDIETKVAEEAEDTSEGSLSEDHEEYLTGLYQNVEQELEDLAQGIAWSSDEDNIYMDVNFADGHVFTFTIPKADLAYDIDNMGNDIEYICVAVREADSPLTKAYDEAKAQEIPAEDPNYDMSDYYAPEDRPAYV